MAEKDDALKAAEAEAKRLAEELKRKEEANAKAIAAACKAYGISAKHVHGSAVRGDEVTIVTAGGAKVSWRPGDKVKALDPVRVHGIPAKKKAKK